MLDSQVSNSVELLIENLKLLNYDLDDANQVFRMQIPDMESSFCSKNLNQKLLIHTIHFLLRIISQHEEKEFQNHFRIYYPPRTFQEQNEYKTQFMEYLRKLERIGRIPKNFIYCKAILDEKQGLRQIKFLRFLSEFGLRHEFIQKFPQKQLKTFYPDPRSIMIDNKSKSNFNDLSLIFSPASFQLEGLNGIQMEKCSIDTETISALITLTKNSINFELNKLNKIFLINLKLTENARYIVDFLIESNSNLRKQLISVDQQKEQIQGTLSKKYLSNERQLDRIPLIDLYVSTFKAMRNTKYEFEKLKISEKLVSLSAQGTINKITKTSFGYKGSNFLNLSEITDEINQDIQKIDIKNEIQYQDSLIESSQLLKQNSQKILEDLKHYKSRLRI